ncbi:hypothetical protein HNY73_006485 [Argiope bruennichi]|uniref:Uncharacterized protein n=1 Tax=Argiope bruennichi TaxID=94029 RepID=A0A8T0FMP4_ARGBR|nr:hypothetical protein HNY73_006485 [Argiope bruennichi]
MSRLKLTSDNYEKSEDFTVEYSPPLKIKKLALESFSIKKTWHNISEKFNNNKFKLIEGNNERIIKIPNGSYTVKSLNRYMIELFGIDSPIKFGIIEERELISVNLKKNFKMDLTEGNLHQLLGFKSKILDQENQFGEYIADITHGIDNIYIHCDIVKGSLINNCDSDVIHSFVSKIPHGVNAMSQQHDLDESVAWRDIGYLKMSQIQSVVAQVLGVFQSLNSRLWNRFLKPRSVHRRSRQDHTPARTQNEDRYVRLTARKNHTINATLLQQYRQSAIEAKKLCLPPSVRSFETIVHQRKSIDTAEKFVQTDLSSTSMFGASKISVSTLTDDKICNVTRPPKKKKTKQYNSIDSNENAFVSEFRDSNTFVQDTAELPCSTNPLIESILTDNLLPDDAESDDFIDYDPEETIDEDMINDLRHQPSTSRTITNPSFYSTFKKKYANHRPKQSVKSRATTSGLTYATATKSILETKSTQMISVNLPSDSSSFKKSYIPTEMCPRSTESFLTAFSAKISSEKISHLKKNVSECESTSPDLTGFKQVQKRKKIKKDPKLKPNQNKPSQQVSPKSRTEKESFSKFWKTSPRQISNSAMMQGTKSSVIKKMTKIDTCSGIGEKSNFEHLGVSTLEGTLVLHPEIDTEITISSTSEHMLEYHMSEELEETSEDVCAPPPPFIRKKRPKLKYIIPTKSLLDNGSESSFDSENVINILGLKRQNAGVSLSGISGESAYACVIYAVQRSNNGVTKVTILAAKSKVAPLKPVSIPRLELNGALLLARLLSVLINTFHDPVINLYAWTNSQVVLSWLSSPSRNWKPFVANRTSATLDLIPQNRWRSNMSKQKMGDLPEGRVTLNRPFFVCGTDYAGSISRLKHRGRGSKTTKGYIVVIVALLGRFFI